MLLRCVAWNQVEGKSGYLALKVREYPKKDGGTGQSNEVDEWLLPGDERIARALSSQQASTAQPAAPIQAAMPVPPQPAQAPENSNRGCWNWLPLTVSMAKGSSLWVTCSMP